MPTPLNAAYVFHPVSSVLEWKTVLGIAAALGFVAALYVVRSRPIDAERKYRDVLRLVPFHAEAHNNLGIILFDTGRVNEAVGEYEKAIEADPGYADALYRETLEKLIEYQEGKDGGLNP